MGLYERAVSQSLLPTPPRAYGQPGSGPFGQVVVFAISTTPVVVDLRSLNFGVFYDPTAADTAVGAGAPVKAAAGAVGSFLSLYADGADIGYISGPTLASVTNANVPVLSTTGTLTSSGLYQAAAAVCYRLSSGQERRFRLVVTQDNFLAIVGAGNGIVRLFISSEPSLQ